MGGEAKGKLFEVSILKQLKHNYSLLPIFFIGVFGVALSTFAIGRTLFKSPDAQISKKGYQFDKLVGPDGQAIQYKYFTTLDYSKLPKAERPKLD